MGLEKNRHVQIALYFMQNNRIITSEELAKVTKASTRTVKSDIVTINDDLKEHGAEILSKKSEGYYLNVFEQELYEDYRRRLEIVFYYTDREQEISYRLRVSAILRRLLSVNDYISIDDLAEMMFMSRSALKIDLQKVRAYLESYGLKLESRPNYGLRVTGEERHFRSAMVNAYGINIPTFEKNIDEEAYRGQLEGEDYEDVRHIVLDVLRDFGYSIKDNASQGLARYLFASRSRISAGYGHVHLEQKMKDEADQFELQRKITEELFRRLEGFEGFDFSEDEKYNITIYLIAYHDYEGAEITENTMKFLFNDIQKIYYESTEFIKNSLGLVDYFSETREQLLYNISRIIVRSHFGMLPYNLVSYSTSYEAVRKNPMAISLASYLSSYLEERLFCRLNTKDTLYLAHYFDELLERIKFEYRKQRLVTSSGIGKNYAEIVAKRINDRFKDFIESNETMELYEIRPYTKDDIDLIVMDNMFHAYRYDFKYVVAERRDYSQLIEALKRGFVIDNEVKEIASMIKFYQSYEFLNREDCFRILSYKYGVDDLSINEMISIFKRHEERLSYGRYGFVLLMADYRFVQRSCFEVYLLKEPMAWSESMEIRNIMFVSADFFANLKLMKAFACFVSSLYEDENLLNALLENEKREELIKSAILRQIDLNYMG